MLDLRNCSRAAVLDYFNNTWTINELLFSSLIGDEPFYRPPYHGLRHPLVFYYVHPSVLYVSKLRLAGLLDAPVNPYFESLFETGVDEMSWDDMSKNVIEWPNLDDCLAYRKQVYDIVKNVIESHPGLAEGHAPITGESPLWALFMGMEHERIHLETSSVLIRELPVHLVSTPPQWPKIALEANDKGNFPPVAGRHFPENNFVAVAAGAVVYGKPTNSSTYGWDNEYGNRQADLQSFTAGSMLVSNGEFWQFVEAGGYHQETLWSSEGWRWRSFRNIKWPTFWVPDGPAGSNQFRLRTCFEVVNMQWSWPAIVNFHEARAFCQWKNSQSQTASDGQYRLLTEAEHQALRLVSGTSGGGGAAGDSAELLPAAPLNTNLRQGSECAVDFARTSTDSPFFDVFGNVWQWAEDHFNQLDGFKIHRLYDDFSTPCFDGQHQMIMGGSFISTGDEASVWARYHFRPHFYQHAGFRLVKTAADNNGAVVHLGGTAGATNPYETQSIFDEYMTLHFAPPQLQMPYESGPVAATQFPQRCADLVNHWCEKLGIIPGRALDIGCAVGGASFRLADSFAEVTGVDLSERFIDAAKILKEKHQLAYNYKVEADIYHGALATVSAEAAQRTTFRQADAGALPAEFMHFDAVLMANLLCRLPSPAACLRRLSGSRGMVRPGGLLVTVSPFTWMSAYTPKELWLGGYVDDQGKECFSEDGLKAFLADDFELLESQDMPLVIREHRRKFQYIVSQAMVWRRR